MERETKSFTTPGGHVILIKTYLTGREANSIKEDLFKNMKLDQKGDVKETEITGDFILKQEMKLISTLVVSVNGDTNAYVEKLLDLKNEDYQSVIKEVNLIYNGNLTVTK